MRELEREQTELRRVHQEYVVFAEEQVTELSADKDSAEQEAEAAQTQLNQLLTVSLGLREAHSELTNSSQ